MSADKYPSILSHQMEAIVYIFSASRGQREPHYFSSGAYCEDVAGHLFQKIEERIAIFSL